MSKRSHILWLLGLFAVAFGARLWFIKFYPQGYLISPDGYTYSNMAENFLQGKGIITTIRDRDYVVGPIYPLFLAFMYLLFGLKNYAAAVVFQAGISALTVVLGYKIGEELFGKKYALIPYALFLLYPQFSFWNVYILTETFYIFGMTLFIYAGVLYSKRMGGSKIRYPLFLGGVLGLANLIRPMLLLVFPVLLLWMWLLNHWKMKRTLRDFALVTAMAVLVMSPWWVRNYLRYDQFIPATNYGSLEFYAGNNPYTVITDYYSSKLISYDPKVREEIDKLPALEQEKRYSALAKTYILEHPLLFLGRTLTKEKNLFWKPIAQWEADQYGFKAFKLDRWFLWLGLAGTLISIFWFRRFSFLLLLTVYYSFIVSMITVVSGGRYRVPIMPAVIVLGSFVFVSAVKLLLSVSQREGT